MKSKSLRIAVASLMVLLSSLACGSFSMIDVESPTQENTSVDSDTPVLEPVEPAPIEVPSPTETAPAEDYSHLWMAYRDPKFGYGVALPSHWSVQPTIVEGMNGTMTAVSYDEEFFRQNAIRGHWIDGAPPEGAYKLEFSVFEGVMPEQETAVALSQILDEIQGMITLSIEETSIGDTLAFNVTHTDVDGPEGQKWVSVAFRLRPDLILRVHAYPFEAIDTQQVQIIMNSLVFLEQDPVLLPTIAPTPPFELTNEVGVYPSAHPVIAWRGHIVSLLENNLFDDKVVLFSDGDAEFGIKGSTPEIEAEIVSLRDASGPGEWVNLWGHLFCNYNDYNKCRLTVEKLEYGGKLSGETIFVDGWVGTVKTAPAGLGSPFIFVISEPVPVWYSISSGGNEIINSQIENLSDSNTQVKVWGEVLLETPNPGESEILVESFDPPGPRALPSSDACESGYLGSAAEMLEVFQYNLEIGNYYPFSYMIGNPFVIGYWQSEGVSIPRGEAYDMLVNSLFPSPDEVVIITDPSQFPDLFGTPLSTMWGPDVDVAANLYMLNWGPDGEGEVIAVIARCQEGNLEAYFWYGILYAGKGFD